MKRILKRIWQDRSFLTLTLALLLILVTGYIKPRTWTADNWKPDYSWAVKTHYKTGYDMLILGDSRAIRAFSPSAMASYLTGYRIFNFSYSGGGLNPMMYKAAYEKLDPTSSTKIILLGITPRSLTYLSNANVLYLKQKQMPGSTVFQRVYINPLLAFFQPVSLEKTTTSLFNTSKEYLDEDFRSDGWVATTAYPPNPQKLLQPYRQYYSKTKVSTENVHHLAEQTARWVKKGIRVFALRVPTTEAMVDLEEKLSGFNEAYLKEKFFAAGGTWITVSNETYRSYDGSHLEKESAVLLSRDVARIIKRHIK